MMSLNVVVDKIGSRIDNEGKCGPAKKEQTRFRLTKSSPQRGSAAFLGKHPYLCRSQHSRRAIFHCMNSLRRRAEITLVASPRWLDPNRAKAPQQIQGVLTRRRCLELMPALQPAHVDGWLVVIVTERQVTEIRHGGTTLSKLQQQSPRIRPMAAQGYDTLSVGHGMHFRADDRPSRLLVESAGAMILLDHPQIKAPARAIHFEAARNLREKTPADPLPREL